VVSFAGKTLKQLSMMHSESTILRKSGTKRKDERHKKSRKSTAEKKSCNLNACPYYRELQAYTRSLLEKFSLPVVSTPLALEETQVEAYRSEAAGGPPHCLHDEKYVGKSVFTWIFNPNPMVLSHLRPILGSSPVWDQGRFVVRDSLTPPVDEGHLSYAGGDGQDQILVGKRSSRRAQTNRKTSSMAAELSSGNLDCHTLLMCEEYGQGGQGPQPFAVKMHPTAAFLCDLHAHLSESEIIGLLGGRWDEQGKCLYIHMPFPCRATEREDDGSTDVEMESTSQVEAARLVSESGLVVVGWYHSHPTFQPEPSVTDIENQANFQNMFKDAAPCVGLIVGTHGESPTDYVSHFNFFHVPDVGRVNLPLRLRAHVLSCTPSYQDEAAYSATGLSECKEMLSRLCQLDLERRNRQNELRVQAGMLPSTTNPRKVPRRCKSALMSDTSEAGKGEGLPKSLQFIVEVGDLPQAGMERLFQDLGFLAVNPPMVFGSEFAALVHAHGCALTPLQGLCHSAKQLCAYYAHVERRVNFASPWRGGISRGEKMARALSVWLKFLEAPLVQAADVLRDVCQLFFATWSEKGVEDFSKRMERNPPSHRCVDGSKCPAVAL
jgi:proteasome lid subunit RPN8/RPN11